MKKRTIRGMAYITAFSMMMGVLAPGAEGKVAASTAIEAEIGEQTSYLIQTTTEYKYEQVQAFCEEELSVPVDSSEELQQEQIMVASLTEEEAESIDSMSGVTIEEDKIMEGTSQSKEEKEDAYIEAIEETVEAAWDVKAVNAEDTEIAKDIIKVAVLDSGYDKVGDIECSGYENLVDSEMDINGEDYSGHGTAVTSVIKSGSQNRGTEGVIDAQKKIEIYSVKVLDAENQAPISRVIQGIQWCIDYEINIINMSFGTTYYSTILEDAIERAEQEGILMIASVGNNGEDKNVVEYPAAFEEVVGVGSVNEKMEHSVFSATGEEVELVAPGENIPLTSYWGMTTVGSGTSYAAPHVTAIAALLWAKDSGRSSDSIRGLLQKSARKLGDQTEFGYGLVDYEYASEIYEEYMEVYQESGFEAAEETQKIEDNATKVVEYEVPEVVQGSWFGEYHYNQVWGADEAGGYSKQAIKYIMAGSIAPDRAVYLETDSKNAPILDLSISSYTNDAVHYDVLHARRNTNYVAAVRCLVNAAIMLQRNGNTEEARNEAEMYFAKNYRCSAQSNDDCWEDIAALDAALYVACFYRLKTDGTEEAVYVKNGVSANRAAHQLLGMAIHVATDAYAHRTVIPAAVGSRKKAEKNGYSHEYGAFQYLHSYFTDINQVYSDIKQEKLTTTGVRIYEIEGYHKTIHQTIADKVEFLPLRYNQGSFFAIAELLFLFVYKDRADGELPYTFCTVELYHQGRASVKYNLKLDGLMRNMQDVGYLPQNYPLATVAEWQALSN